VFLVQHYGLWACNSANIQLITNSCESFHSYFNKNFYSNSPSVISWLNIIRNNIQTDNYIKMNSVEIPPQKKTKTKKRRKDKNTTKKVYFYTDLAKLLGSL